LVLLQQFSQLLDLRLWQWLFGLKVIFMIQSKQQLLNDTLNQYLEVNEDKTVTKFDLVGLLNEVFNTAYRMGLIKMLGEHVESLEDYK
jgi:hypothetical protein